MAGEPEDGTDNDARADDATGEMVPFDADESSVTDTEDGGAIVTVDDDDDLQGQTRSPDFMQNLAETLPEPDLQKLSTGLIELIERDKEARRKRDEQYEEGIRRTGMGNDAPGGASFEGASKVVHPMITEACVDFAARAIKEILPPSGPAKDFIPGEVTGAKVQKAKRKTALMNWQLTVQSEGFRAEMEQMLTQVPLAGAQYLKTTWTERKNRPNFLFVPIDDMFLPFAATNFYSAERKTHRQYITRFEYDERVRSKQYRDVDVIVSSMEPEQSAAAKANQKIEGKDGTSYNEDGLREVYEVYTSVSLEDEEDGAKAAPKPYIITIDKTSTKVLSIYRNWDEFDDTCTELEWFVEFPMIPWRGAYPIGLTHMIGSLAGAATGALRALLDAALINNSQSMIKLKGTGSGGQSIEIQPTQIAEIEGGLNVDDIRKLAMPLPYNPPSTVLYQLLGFLTEAGKGVVRTTVEDGQESANTPVGTTLARIEQGMTVFSSIHSRLHAAMARLLRILHRLNGMYLDDDDIEAEIGEELATRADFEGPMDVVPVSDPNIFSEAQRYAQMQAIVQRADLKPDLYNSRKVEERILETMKIPNAKDLLRPAMEPKEQNAINENVGASLGRPIVAFPEQDHIAHLKAHLSFLLNPVFGGNPLMQPALVPAMLGHIKEHIVLWYAATAYDLANEVTGKDIGEELKLNKTPQEKQAFDRAMSEIAMVVGSAGPAVFGPMGPALAPLLQMMQQMQPPHPMDPSAVAAQDVARKARDDQAKTQIKAKELEVREAELAQDQQELQVKTRMDVQEKQTEMAAEAELQRQREEGEDRRAAADVAARITMNTDDNKTALTLADLELESHEKFPVSTGTGINPGT